MVARANVVFSHLGKMADLHVDQASWFAEGLMATEVRAPNPRSGRVVAKLVREYALEHEDFLATPVGVRLKVGSWCPMDQRDMLVAIFVDGEHG